MERYIMQEDREAIDLRSDSSDDIMQRFMRDNGGNAQERWG